jgi:hypothetical protein
VEVIVAAMLVKVVGAEDTQKHASIRQIAFASFIETTIEWYDFYLYGTAAFRSRSFRTARTS